MPDTLNLTQNYQVEAILPELMSDEMAGDGPDPLLEALPPVHEDTDFVRWDQYENGYGLLNLRGLGGEPDVTQVPGMRHYAVAPGYYGERVELDETEMTKTREPGTTGDPADPKKRVAVMMQYQADKCVNRFRVMDSELLRTGRFRVTSANGRVIHADQIENYRTFQAGISWSASPTTAVPINDLLTWQASLELGTSSDFGTESTILAPPEVLVHLFATTQIQTAYRSKFGSSVIGLDGLNELLLGFGLPKIKVYKKNYYPTLADAIARTNATRVIPTRNLIWLGRRPKGQVLGKFVLTRHVGNTGPFNKDDPYRSPVRDKFQWADGLYVRLEYTPRMPFKWELDVAFNGGPVVHFPSAAAGLSYAA